MDKEGIFLRKQLPIFYSALMLTAVNLLLRAVGTSFQVYLSGRIGATGIGLLQLVMSVGSLAMVAGMGGIRTAAMYLAAGELGRKKPENVTRVLSGCFAYSILFSGTVSLLLYTFAPAISGNWIGDARTLGAIRLFAGFLPCVCLCGILTGYLPQPTASELWPPSKWQNSFAPWQSPWLCSNSGAEMIRQRPAKL